MTATLSVYSRTLDQLFDGTELRPWLPLCPPMHGYRISIIGEEVEITRASGIKWENIVHELLRDLPGRGDSSTSMFQEWKLLDYRMNISFSDSVI